MKKKYFFVISFLILAMFLVGCSGGGIVTPATDEAKIKTTVYEYCLALSNLNFSKAKSYCVYGSDIYYAISQTEALLNNAYLYCNIITFNYLVNIQNVSINGDYATVSGYTTKLLTYCGYYETLNEDSNYKLQKISNGWKLYLKY